MCEIERVNQSINQFLSTGAEHAAAAGDAGGRRSGRTGEYHCPAQGSLLLLLLLLLFVKNGSLAWCGYGYEMLGRIGKE